MCRYQCPAGRVKTKLRKSLVFHNLKTARPPWGYGVKEKMRQIVVVGPATIQTSRRDRGTEPWPAHLRLGLT